MKIAIIGGGIVGLATALSLKAAGMNATVYEAVPELRPLGVGINLLPHAVRELAEIGLLEPARKLGIEIESLDYHMADGRPVWGEARGLQAGYNWPQIAVHRGNLQLFLRDQVLEQLGPDAIRTGCVFERAEQLDDGSALLYFSGMADPIAADVVIGADGIHSTLRRQFYPDEGKPKWNGVSLFRATTLMPAASYDPKMLWAGHADQKFIAYPIGRDGDQVVLNWVCDIRTGNPGDEPFEDWNRKADKQWLIPRYQDWQWSGIDIPSVIAAGGDVFEFPMVDRDPLPRWSFGCMTLAGDAAHPMYPIGSNGATQGLIDARVLAYHLATADNVETALQCYEAARLTPTSQIVMGNRAGGPDKVLEVARQRAGDKTIDLDQAVPMAERVEIAASYKKLAGFDPASLNARASWSPA